MSVSIDESLYRRLKRAAGSRGMSRYIAEAVSEKLRSSDTRLRAEYESAAADPERRNVSKDWDAIETEGW